MKQPALFIALTLLSYSFVNGHSTTVRKEDDALVSSYQEKKVAAQSEFPDSLHFTDELDELFVVGKKSPVKVSSALPVQSIGTSAIESLGVVSLADAVKHFAGTNVKDYGGIGGLKTVSVRNMGAAHTGISYDGVPVTNISGGQVDLSQFSLDNVADLSLSIGQTEDPLQPASLYASGAVLGIRTMTPAFQNGQKTHFELGVQGGSFGYVSPRVRWWQKYGEKVSSSLDFSFLRADGEYPFILENGNATGKEKRTNSDTRTWHGEGNIYYNIDPSSSLDLKGYWYWSERGLPGGITFYNPISTERLADRNAFVQLKYTKEFSEKWSLRGIAKYNYGWSKDSEENPKYAGGYYRDIFRQRETFLSVAANCNFSELLSVSLATDGILNTFTSTQADNPFPKRFTSRTALTAKWAPGRFSFTGTLLGTITSEHVKTGEKARDYRRLSPGIAMNWKVLEERLLYLRAMYKSTFRMPTFNDLYYARTGVRSLRPEKADEFDLGITWSGAPLNWMNYLSVTADVYYNTVRDKLVAFPTTFNWRMVNFGKVEIYGLDITLASSLTIHRNLTIDITGSYTLQKALNLADKGAKDYRHQLPYTPVNSGSLGVVLNTRWLTAGYTANGVGKRYFLNQNIPANEIKGYLEQNLTLSRELKVKNLQFTFKGELINLANVQYEVIRYYPMPGRSWRLGVSCRF